MRESPWKSSAGGSGLWIKSGSCQIAHRIGMLAQLVTIIGTKEAKVVADFGLLPS